MIPDHKYLVSAIVSTFDSEKYLCGCLEDLFEQTLYRKGLLEIIVVDSGSRQGEEGIVRDLQEMHPHLRYLRTARRETIYRSWNRGIEAASGDFVTNANTDDRHAPYALQRLANFLLENEQVDVVYADSLITSTDNATWDVPHCTGIFRWPDCERRLLFDCCIMGPHPMWRRCLHARHGFFDSSLVSAGDYEFWLRVSEAGVGIAHLRDVLGLYLENPFSISLSDVDLSWRESELARDRYWPVQWGKRPKTNWRSFARPLTQAGYARIRQAPQPPERRLLLCCDYFWPSVGGVELYVEDLGRILQMEGFKVEVAARWVAEREGLERAGLVIHQFRLAGGVATGKVSGEGLAFQDLVLNGGYDTVIALSQPDNWVGMALLELPAIRPRIIFVPSINAENVTEWQANGLFSRIAQVLAVPDEVVAVTETGHDARFLSFFRNDVRFIPHAVTHDAVKANFRELYALSADQPLLVMVANFWPVKNHASLLETLSLVPGDWQLLLIGNPVDLLPEYHAKIVSLALQDRRVRLIGPLCRELAAAAIRDADILLVPSKGESAGPLVVLQAMSYGTAWVAAPECNAVKDLAGGIVAKLEGFPEAISNLLAQPDARSALGRLGQEHWQSCFTWSKTLPAFLELVADREPMQDLRMPLALRCSNAQLKANIRLNKKMSAIKGILFSVVITTYNRSLILLKCLKALAVQEFPFSCFEVIVCDDGSTDCTEEAVTTFEAPFRLQYLHQNNMGPATARNMGIRKAVGQYLLFLNDDAIAESDLLANHYDAHQRSGFDRIAVLGSFTLMPEHSTFLFGHLLNTSDILFEFNKLIPGALHNYQFFYTCNVSVSNKAVMDVGMFDEEFSFSTEDIEFGYRLGNEGYRILYDPTCATGHDHSISVDAFCKTHLLRGCGAATLFAKHPELNWYRKLDQSRAAAWRRRLERRSGRIKTLLHRVNELNREPVLHFEQKSLARRAATMLPLMRKLQHHFMLQGVLSSPDLERLIASTTFRRASVSSPATTPLVSVVVTCYNYARFLQEAVWSVLAQSYQNFEIVIVNDGSTDNTHEVAEALKATHPDRIRLINQENSGQPAISRNNGIAQTWGKYILCLDADDMVAPRLLQECVALLERDQCVSIAYTDQIYFNATGSRTVKTCRYSLRRLLRANFIGSCSLYRRTAFEDAGGYRTNVRGYEDWDFWIACGERGHFGRRIPSPLFLYRQHAGGLYASALPDDERLRAQVILNHSALYGDRKMKWAQEVLKREQAQGAGNFTVVALISAHNEGDVISHVIGDLIEQGIAVYLIDHCSTDNTVVQAQKWLGRGLLHVESFPKDAGYPQENRKWYLWSHILRRKEELSAMIDADWFIHHDADEFRESPWEGVALVKAIRMVDCLGFNAISFTLLDFHPVDDCFLPGSDVRNALRYYKSGESFNQLQIKAWKKQPRAVNLVGSAGHSVDFPGKKTFPVGFLLRHYPVRSQSHGMEKVFKRRKERFSAKERGTGWHQQYDHISDDHCNFLNDPRGLDLYDGKVVRNLLVLEDAAVVASRLLYYRTSPPWLTVKSTRECLVERYATLIGAPPPATFASEAEEKEYHGLLQVLAQEREARAAQLHDDPKNRLSWFGRSVKLWHFCRIRADLAASRLWSRWRLPS